MLGLLGRARLRGSEGCEGPLHFTEESIVSILELFVLLGFDPLVGGDKMSDDFLEVYPHALNNSVVENVTWVGVRVGALFI